MPYKSGTFEINDRMLESITRYIDEHCPVGDFLQAVIANDLKEAIWQADNENYKNLYAFVQYFYWEAPSECWGSPEKYKAWIESTKEEEKKP